MSSSPRNREALEDATFRAGMFCDCLKEHYPGPETALRFTNPLELLIATILSAQCTDERVNGVTEELFKKYRTAQDYATAEVHELEREIIPTGFYRNKARSIISCAAKLVQDHGGQVPSTMEELTALPGVGRKTASVVLAAGFGIAALAVDTHVLRVANRLALVETQNADRAQAQLKQLLPEADWRDFSLAAILFGRAQCRARKPLCGTCFAFSLCRWPDKSAMAGA